MTKDNTTLLHMDCEIYIDEYSTIMLQRRTGEHMDFEIYKDEYSTMIIQADYYWSPTWCCYVGEKEHSGSYDEVKAMLDPRSVEGFEKAWPVWLEKGGGPMPTATPESKTWDLRGDSLVRYFRCRAGLKRYMIIYCSGLFTIGEEGSYNEKNPEFATCRKRSDELYDFIVWSAGI